MLRVRYLFALCCFIVLTACFNNQFIVTSDFAEIDGIEVDKAVYFEKEVVGKVSAIKETEGGHQVTIELQQDKVTAINSDAVIYLNTIKANFPLEIYNRNQNSDISALENGQQIQSIDTPLELSAWLIGDVLQLGVDTISNTLETFQNYLGSEQFSQDKAVVQQQIGNAANAAEQIISSLEAQVNDVLQGVTESESEAIQSVEQLTQELAPVIEDLGEKGVEVARQLDQIVQNMKHSAVDESGEKPVGSGIVIALLEGLSSLNASLEKGVQNGVELSDETSNDTSTSIDTDENQLTPPELESTEQK